MPMGRPIKGVELVNNLEGEQDQKDSLKIILGTITGEMTIIQACEKLGIKESRFHELREKVLQSALDGLKPKPSGRPVENATINLEYKKELDEMKIRLEAERIKTLIAQNMPELFIDYNNYKKKEAVNQGKKKKKLKQQKKSRKRNR